MILMGQDRIRCQSFVVTCKCDQNSLWHWAIRGVHRNDGLSYYSVRNVSPSGELREEGPTNRDSACQSSHF